MALPLVVLETMMSRALHLANNILSCRRLLFTRCLGVPSCSAGADGPETADMCNTVLALVEAYAPIVGHEYYGVRG